MAEITFLEEEAANQSNPNRAKEIESNNRKALKKMWNLHKTVADELKG